MENVITVHKLNRFDEEGRQLVVFREIGPERQSGWTIANTNNFSAEAEALGYREHKISSWDTHLWFRSMQDAISTALETMTEFTDSPANKAKNRYQ